MIPGPCPPATALALLVSCALLSPAQPPLRPGRKYTTVERLAPERLAAVRAAREAFARALKPPPPTGVYQHYPAAVHVHAEDSAHTRGTRPEVLRAARETGIRIVMFSDHDGPQPDTWHDEREGVLFFAGAENGSAHELIFPRPAPGLRFHSHVEGQLEASDEGWDGMEIYNRHADAEDDADLVAWLRQTLPDPERFKEFAALAARYPDEVFGSGCDYWPEIFARWDRILTRRPFPGLAATDAHQNQVATSRGVRLVLDPYPVAFRNAVTYILARELTHAAILASLKAGRAYVSHDWLAPASGFVFAAVNNLGLYQMGDSVPMASTTRLHVRLPLPARIRIIHQGAPAAEETADRLIFPARQPGAYRVEAWLEVDGEQRPWIYSNPIYLRAPAPTELQLPSQTLAGSVESVKDIPYVEGTLEDKQKLDLYRPRGARHLPVLFFLHGGAWRSGDRKQYPFLANRLVQEGFAVVVPSYRLVPKHPYPAAAEDAASALAWTLKNVQAHGGDPSRVWVAGHSAGAHLATLVTGDRRWLEARQASPEGIRGILAVSGVYDIAALAEGANSPVFGNDPALWDAASPIRFVRPGLPPLLLAYCQWDYPSLPQQATRFHDALAAAGARARLVYIEGENHISEVANAAQDSSPLLQALLGFTRHPPPPPRP
jgi:acetyl esterase/lipase